MMQISHFYKQLQEDPEKGFRGLYAYEKNIKLWLKQHNAGKDECNDIIHDAMIALYQYAQKRDFILDINPEQLLFGIAKNIWFKLLRSKKNMPLSELPDALSEDASLEELIEKELQYKQMQQALSTMGTSCKELLFLFYFKKLPLEQIAEKLGLRNASVAKTTKYQCLQKAKNLIFN